MTGTAYRTGFELMLPIERVRASFPHLSRCTYLNTASVGLSWLGQGAAAAEFYDSVKSKGSHGMGEWRAKSEAARRELGALLGVPADNLSFVGSTSEALTLLALSMPLLPGDQVVLAADEFPSIVHAWSLRESAGIEIVRVPIPREADRTQALAEAIGPRARVLVASHVHWRSGTKIDLARLKAACDLRNCRFIVDGAHAIGAVEVAASCVDAYCAPVFKWLLSGFGLGFLMLSDQLAGELTPVLRSYNNEAPSRTINYAHVNYPGVYALHATLVMLRNLGWDAIHARTASLAAHLASALRDSGFDVLTPEHACAGIVSFQHARGTSLVRALAGQAIVVEDGSSVVRASPHFYNTAEELDRFVLELGRLV